MRALLKQSLIIYLIFDLTILPMRQTLNATLYFRTKYIPDTLIHGKSKVKETLKNESDELNNFSSRYILKTQIQIKIFFYWLECSNSSRKWSLSTSKVHINRRFRGGPYRIDQRRQYNSSSQGNSKNVAVSPMFSTVSFLIKVLSQEDFPNVHSLIQSLLSRKTITHVLLVVRLKHFQGNWWI